MKFNLSKCQVVHVTGSNKTVKTDYVLHGQVWGEAQWLSGRVLDSRPRGHGSELHRRHCVVVLEQDTFILA